MSGAPTLPTSAAGNPGFHWIHHALAAALMASAMLGLEKIGWLDWLDAVMLNVVSTEAPAAVPARTEVLPQVLLIDGEAYADTFGLHSPLDRAALAGVIEDALRSQPHVLLVDLQLEPVPGEAAERPLDALLAGAVTASATRVALPLPQMRTTALDQRSMLWMRQMCESGVRFGSAQVRSHFGTVVRLDRDAMSIAQVAGDDGHGAAGSHAATSLCFLARQGASLGVLWSMLKETERHVRGEPLPPGIIKRLEQGAMRWRPHATAAELAVRRPGVVVVGGAYDDRDRFVTSALPEPVPGVLVHAAALTNEKLHSDHAAAWALDVVLGTVLGALFAAGWGWVGTAHLPVGWHCQHVVRAWLVPAKATAVWLLATVLTYLLMKAAGGLMAYGLWLNPGPMVLGMLLHTLLLKDESGVKSVRSWRELWLALTMRHSSEPITGGRDYTRHHPAWPLQLVLIGVGLICGLSGSH